MKSLAGELTMVRDKADSDVVCLYFTRPLSSSLMLGRFLTHSRPRSLPSICASRPFASSAPLLARRAKPEEKLTPDQAFDLLEDEYDDDDTASAGHLMLRQQRQVLYYLRLIEHEMPKLVGQPC